MKWAPIDKKTGFTIVELLVVIVVIAILAAITIVAYNGIQNRAKDSAAQAEAAQVTQKILSYAVEHSDAYPDNLTTLAQVLNMAAPAPGATTLTTADAISYQYTANNSTTPKSYCLTTTKNNISFVTNAASGNSPSKGACPGHGSNGVAAVVNLVITPRPSTSYWTASSTGVAGVTYVGTGVDAVARSTRKTTASYALYASRATPTAIAQAGDVYTAIFTLVSPQTTTVTFQVGVGTATSSIGELNRGVALTAGVPQTVRHTFTVPSGYDGQGIFSKFLWNEGVVNDSFDVSKVMWVKGEYSGGYADGGTAGWAWSGEANNSTSSGPPV